MDNVIGGEFAVHSNSLQEAESNLYPHAIDYSSGRCALYAILNDLEYRFGKGKILLPDYLCDSITNTVTDAGWHYRFYHITASLQADTDRLAHSDAADYNAILLINYFGMTDISGTMDYIKEIFPGIVIIADHVQAFYEQCLEKAEYTFTSLRKWFPCPDGAMVTKMSPHKVTEIPLARNIWSQYKLAGNLLKGYSPYIDSKIYLKLIEKGENLLDQNYLSACSEASKNIMGSLDINKIAETRRQNAAILHTELVKLKIHHLYSADKTPLFIPIFINNRDAVRNYFFQNNIFTPNHWPHTDDKTNGANTLYDTELSLICDQRYGRDDMLRQIAVLKQFIMQTRED